MDVIVAILIPLVCLVIGAWGGIRIERHRRDRQLDELFDERPAARPPS